MVVGEFKGRLAVVVVVEMGESCWLVMASISESERVSQPRWTLIMAQLRRLRSWAAT